MVIDPQTLLLRDMPGGARAKAKRSARSRRGPRPLWEQHVGIRITAMARAGDTIAAAGSPDIVDPADPHGAWEGRKGGTLALFATKDGNKRAEYILHSPPVWDGMAVAYGRLYLALQDGTIVCWSPST